MMEATKHNTALPRSYPGAGSAQRGTPSSSSLSASTTSYGSLSAQSRRRNGHLLAVITVVACWCMGRAAAGGDGDAAVAGQLHLRVSSFINLGGQVVGGGCCLHPGRPLACSPLCRTFFRVCISHAPRSGPVVAGGPKNRTGAVGACPLGLLVTRVVANGTLEGRDHGVLDMAFPFTQQWPVDFKLILEAWHDVTGQLFKAPRPGKERGGQLIARHVAHHHQEGGSPWSFHAHANAHTSLRYALKVTCAALHHGRACSQVCGSGGSGLLGRQCNTTTCEDGRCSCPDGWTGPLCDAPVCGPNCSTEHGYCGVPGECRCEVGWWGERCDLCFPYPGCQHGTCKEPWQCVCEPGWSGDLCNAREAPEGYNRTKENGGAEAQVQCGCLNGGTCMAANPPLNYTCSCPALFTGTHCDYLARSSSPRLLLSGSGTRSTSQDDRQKDEVEEEEDPKVTRRRLLQKHARISFRPVKFVSGGGNRAGQTPTPSPAVAERKLLPLPVVLPRVTEMSPANHVSSIRKHKSVSKQPLTASQTTGSGQDPTRKNFIPSARGGNIPARPRLVQVLNSQRRPILVSLPAAPPTPPPNPPSTTPIPPTPDTDTPPTRFPPTLPANTRPTTAEPRGPINLYPRKITTPPPPPPTVAAPTAPHFTTTSTRSSSNNNNNTSALTPRPWPRVALWPPARRAGPIPRRHVLQRPPTIPKVGVAALTRRVHSVESEGQKTSGTERLETLRPLPRELESQSALRGQLDPRETQSDFEYFHLPSAREIAATYYEQNANGRVHIGDVSRVDSAPAQEIMDAFIELKKV